MPLSTVLKRCLLKYIMKYNKSYIILKYKKINKEAGIINLHLTKWRIYVINNLKKYKYIFKVYINNWKNIFGIKVNVLCKKKNKINIDEVKFSHYQIKLSD